MRVALVHDWLVNKRGAEHVLEALCEVFPKADIFTLIYNPDSTFESFKANRIETTFIQNLPFAQRFFRYYLPLFPRAIEGFDLKGYDLIVSINHCVAKGVNFSKGTRHICYCLTPMRYVWVYQDEYFGRFRKIFKPVIEYLKNWDAYKAGNTDRFVAVSNHIKNRISRCYGKDSEVIFPPVDVKYFFTELPPEKEDFYLIVSELVPYKRTKLAIDAFNELGLPLVIIGGGPLRKRFEKEARPNIKFLGWQSQETLREYYRKARALIYPQKEDFGIVAVEAQAAGCPVIAYRKGGALDSVIEDKTGVFFNGRTRWSLIEAVRRFGRMSLKHKDLIENAKRFDKESFKRKFMEFVSQK